MNNPQIRQSCLSAFILVALLSASVVAAPQDDIFGRSSDKKTESTKTEATTETPAQTAAASSVQKESTAEVSEQSDGWFTVVDAVSNTEFRLPAKPKYIERSWTPIAGRSAVTNHRYVGYPDKESSFEFSWMNLHEAPENGRQLSDALNGAVKGAVVNVLGQLDRVDKINSGRTQGREFDYTFTVTNPKSKKEFTFSGRSRVFIKGSRRYQLDVITVQGKEDKVATKKLFDSLTINTEE